MRLFGKTWTRRELEARMGRLEQIGGIRRLELIEGPEAGTELIQVRTGAGLCYYVSPMRGLDISLTEFGGIPISWQSPSGDVHPAYYQASEMEWLRTAAGGLLMTCGLTQAGAPGEDQGELLGLHGRIHHIAGRHISARGHWIGDAYEMIVSGILEQTRIFGEYLRLTRELKSHLGENTIHIKDRVENLGFNPVPLMILYHFNFGFPLMSETTRITLPSQQVIPREKQTPLEGYDQWHGPVENYTERVYYHEHLAMDGSAAGWTSAVIENPCFPLVNGGACHLTVRLAWATQNLTRLVQWKMPGAGIHVLGIEPANCYVEGRAKERERGALVTIEPAQAKEFELRLEISAK